MVDQKKATLLDDVLGDSLGVFTNPDPLKAMDADMPSWMTENLLDGPAAKTTPKVGSSDAYPAVAIVEVKEGPDVARS